MISIVESRYFLRGIFIYDENLAFLSFVYVIISIRKRDTKNSKYLSKSFNITENLCAQRLNKFS